MPGPAPIPAFTAKPHSPTTAEAVQLIDCSTDPAKVGIAWRAWDFGDGGTSVGPSPVHRYAAVGDYTVTLTLATFDGRVCHHSKLVTVR